MTDTVAQTEAPELDLPALFSALDSLGNTLAFHSRDWSRHPGDAWLYGILLGWDEDPTGGDVEAGSAIEELTRRHGWTEEQVERLRTLHAAVAAFTIDAVGDMIRRDAQLEADLAQAHRCDALCREVEDERDRLLADAERARPVVEAAKALRAAQRRDVIDRPITVHDLFGRAEEFRAIREAFAAAVDTYEEQS